MADEPTEDKKHMNPLLLVPIGQLLPAPWNYKTDGTQEDIAKLAQSIKQDKSAGVLAVRELREEGLYEVIDGNHRLAAIKMLEWERVPVENFGAISKAKAITISRRRNHEWFPDNVTALAKLIKNDVLPEYSIDDLAKFMPDTKTEIEAMVKLADFDWEQFNDSTKQTQKKRRDGLIELKIVVSEQAAATWNAFSKNFASDTAALMTAISSTQQPVKEEEKEENKENATTVPAPIDLLDTPDSASERLP